MKINKILITADDGYDSVGVRTLAKIFKKKYSVKIAATLNQQSGTGGKLSLSDELSWGTDNIEGVEALWVDGSPVDAVEVAQGFFKDRFDLVLSGINYGENLSYSLVSSGTFSAAVRALGVEIASRGVILSWQTHGENFTIKHNKNDSITAFLDYPGKKVYEIVEMIIKNNFYGKELINVNFPNAYTDNYKVVPVSKSIIKLWKYPLEIDNIRKVARQPKQMYSDLLELDTEVDVGALHAGFITISPINYLC